MKAMTYRLALVGLAATATALGVATIPAGASATHAVSHHSSSSAVVRGVTGGQRITAGHNDIVAGYYGKPAAVISDTSTFTAPSFSCANDTDTEDFAVGPYVYDSTAAQSAAADIQFVCEAGASYYAISAYTNGGGNNYVYNVNAGDVISATISESAASGTTTAVVVDLTTGFTETSSGSNGADGNPDTFLSEGVLTYYPDVPTFTTITQTNCMITGVKLSKAGFTAWNLETGSDVQVKTDPAAGSTLENVFKHNT